MTLRAAALVLALAPSLAAAGDEQALEDAVRKLAALERVEGSAVGYAGEPGRFFLLSRILLENGNSALFEKLAADRRPVTRAMGLYCLAQADAQRAIPILRRRLCDRGRFQYAPGGCLFWTSSVGAFSRSLLRNKRCIEMEPPAPLVSGDQRLALDVEILARDDCSDVHGAAARTLAENPPPLRLPELKRLCPNLKAWQLIKAIGRLPPQQRWRDFLIACLRDGTPDTNARRAAASALTRDPDQRALAALKETAEDRFIRDAELCHRHAALMAQVRAETTWWGMERIKATVIAAFTIDHPLALPDLDESFGYAILRDHEDVRRAVAGSLLRLAARHKEFREPWDTFSDLPRRLERIVSSERFVSEPKLLRPEERAEILAKLRD